MAYVTVGCKLPNGLIMELDGNRVTLAGANSSNIIGGHGITENVDKDFWDAWSVNHAELSFMKEGHVFANEKPANVKDKAKERAKEKTGLEPLDPDAKPAGIDKVA